VTPRETLITRKTLLSLALLMVSVSERHFVCRV